MGCRFEINLREKINLKLRSSDRFSIVLKFPLYFGEFPIWNMLGVSTPRQDLNGFSHSFRTILTIFYLVTRNILIMMTTLPSMSRASWLRLTERLFWVPPGDPRRKKKGKQKIAHFKMDSLQGETDMSPGNFGNRGIGDAGCLPFGPIYIFIMWSLVPMWSMVPMWSLVPIFYFGH